MGLVVLALIVYGGYGEHWRWIGVYGATATLSDRLHLLLLPLAAVVLPLWLRHRLQTSRTVAAAVAALVGGFVCVVLAGYLVTWAWTGFVGNTMWDWLHLLLLPLLVPAVIVPMLRTVLAERFTDRAGRD